MATPASTNGSRPDSLAGRFPARLVLVGAVTCAAMVALVQELAGGGWTLLGLVLGASAGSLLPPIRWKAGGHVQPSLLHAGWQRPRSRKWTIIESVWVTAWFSLFLILLGWNTIASIALAAVVGILGYFGRFKGDAFSKRWGVSIGKLTRIMAVIGLTAGLATGALFGGAREMWLCGFLALMIGTILGTAIDAAYWETPRRAPRTVAVLMSVGSAAGLIAGGFSGDVFWGWILGFVGMMTGGALGAIVLARKWALCGAAIGLVFLALMILAGLTLRWIAHGDFGLIGAWHDFIVAAIFFCFGFAAVAGLLKTTSKHLMDGRSSEEPRA